MYYITNKFGLDYYKMLRKIFNSFSIERKGDKFIMLRQLHKIVTK
jgi:hypothetical protein